MGQAISSKKMVSFYLTEPLLGTSCGATAIGKGAPSQACYGSRRPRTCLRGFPSPPLNLSATAMAAGVTGTAAEAARSPWLRRLRRSRPPWLWRLRRLRRSPPPWLWRLRRLRPPLERLRRNRDRLRRLRWLRRWWLLVLGERRTNLVLVLGPVTSCLLRMLSQGSAPGSAYRKNAADYRDRSQGRLPHASLGAGVNRKFFPVSPDHSPGLFPGVPESFFRKSRL